MMALIGCEGVIVDLGNTVEGVVMDGRNLGIRSRPRWQEDGGGGGGVAAGTAKGGQFPKEAIFLWRGIWPGEGR
jgi:hypothetical protein